MKSCLIRAAIGIILGLFLLCIGGYFWTKSYLKSDEFMTLVQYGVSKKVGGHVEVAETTWDGWVFNNEKVEILAGKGFQDLELDRVSIEIDPKGFTKRVWKVSDVHVRDLSLHLGDPLAENSSEQGTKPFDAGPMPVNFGLKDIGKVWLPRKAEVDQIRVEDSTGSFLTDEVSGNWKNMEILLNRDNADYLFTIPRGDLFISKLPDLEWDIMEMKGRAKPKNFYLTAGKISDGGSSVIEFTGEGEYTGKTIFQGTVQDLPISAVMQPDWKKKFLGELNANFILRTTAKKSYKAEGKGTVENATLTALPSLEAVAQQTGIARFRMINFDTFEFDYSVDNGTIMLDNLNLISQDFLKIMGTVTTDGTVGKGQIQLGLHRSLLDKLPAGVESLFPNKSGDHSWADVMITQEDGKWKDDLTPKAMGVILKSMLSGGVNAAESLLKGVSDTLQNGESKDPAAPDSAPAEDLMKKGTDIIKSGAKSLFDLLK